MNDEDLLSKLPSEMTDEEKQAYIEEIKAEFEEDFLYEFDGEKITPNVEQFVRKIKRKLKDNYSQVVVVSSTGQNGKGKSHLLYQMGRAANDDFGLKRNFFFGRTLKQIKEFTDNLPKGDLNLIDEAIRLYYKRRAMTSGVIDLNEWMGADQRKTGVGMVMAIPDFTDLDRYAIKGKVDWWVEVMERGVAIVFKPDRFPTADPWHFAELQAIQKARKNITKEDFIKKIKLLQKHPCYYGLLFWTAMPKEDEKAYLKILGEALTEFGEGAPVDKELNDKYTSLRNYMKDDAVKLLKMLEVIQRRVSTADLEKCGLDNKWKSRMKRWASEDFSKEEKVLMAVAEEGRTEGIKELGAG